MKKIRLGDHIHFLSGGTPSKKVSNYWDGDIPWVSAKDMKSFYLKSTGLSISEQGAKNGSRVVPEGTVMVLVRGMTLFRKFPVIVSRQPMAFNQDIKALEIDKSVLNPIYLGYWLSLKEKYFLSLVDIASHGTGRLNTQTLEDVTLSIPSPNEQKRIAEVLSDVDETIAALDRLIAKKRDIKTATMQQLLTGKTRLPGFSGEWEEINIFDTSTLKARIGWQGLTTSEYLDNGDYYLVTGTEFFDGCIDWDKCYYVDKSRYGQDRNIQLKVNDVLVTKDGTIGKVAYISYLEKPATLNSGVFVIRPKSDRYKPKYLYYVLMSAFFSDFLRKLTAGSTISHLYQKDFVLFNFPIPSNLEEQKAIAQILSDIDEEIENLEKKRNKYKQIKQGMMQELLTGRTRLPLNPAPQP